MKVNNNAMIEHLLSAYVTVKRARLIKVYLIYYYT